MMRAIKGGTTGAFIGARFGPQGIAIDALWAVLSGISLVINKTEKLVNFIC